MSEVLMVVGSLNREAPYFQGARGVGLSVYVFDTRTGVASWLCEDRGIDNPTFLVVHPGNGCLYAGTEVFGWHEGTVSAFRYDAAARRLVYLNKQASLGSITAHLSLDAEARHLLVANYGMGPVGEGPDRAVAVFPLRPDGGLGAAVSSVAHRGTGPDAERQERPHPHCVLPSPDGCFALVSDLGLDALLAYDYGDGALSDAPVARTALPPGCGPRHLAFHPDGDLAVVICELNSTVTSLRYYRGSGAFAAVTTLPTVPAEARSGNHCSDIQIGRNGRFVYGANRGHDSIAIFALDAASGRLSAVGHHPCGGRTPRHLAIDPSGRFLLVANQNSDTVAVLAIDPERGTLSGPASAIPIGSPMCVQFGAG